MNTVGVIPRRACSALWLAMFAGVLALVRHEPATQPEKRPSTTAVPSEYIPDISAPTLACDDAWPARWNPSATERHGVIVPLEVKVSKLGTRRLPGVPVTPTVEERSVFESLVRELAGDLRSLPKLALEGRNSIIFVPSAGGRKRDLTNNFGFGLGPGPAAGPDAELVFVFASGQRKAEPDGEAIELQRTWFAYYDPMGDEKSARDTSGRAVARGVVLLMPGMFGTPEVVLDPLTLRLRASGFGVLRMLSQPSRFTERLIIRVDPADLEGSAREIGGIVNDRLAECAYAVQAAWDHVHQRREGTSVLPHAVIGISGGAISLPTVVARTPSLYRAAVLIGGGADFWLINERSNYQGMIDAVRTVWIGQAPTQELIGAFDVRLLKIARLDSFHTAAALRDVPTLMLHATADRAVPSPLGDVLWERLGRPERWVYPVNHEVLCLGLPAEFGKVLDWLAAAIDGKDSAQPVAPTPADEAAK